MQLPNNACVVACFFQKGRQILDFPNRAVSPVRQSNLPRLMGIPSSQQAGTRCTTGRLGDVCSAEKSTLRGKAVDARGNRARVSIATELEAKVVCRDEDDVHSLVGRRTGVK